VLRLKSLVPGSGARDWTKSGARGPSGRFGKTSPEFSPGWIVHRRAAYRKVLRVAEAGPRSVTAATQPAATSRGGDPPETASLSALALRRGTPVLPRGAQNPVRR